MEIIYNGTWGTVRSDNWDLNDANVVCRQLGFERALKAINFGAFGEGTGKIWMRNVRCIGSESSLRDCAHNSWGTHKRGHNRDAGVVCNYAGPLYFVLKHLSFSLL